jgi:tRNA(fMet)-specific endonuclease VapC
MIILDTDVLTLIQRRQGEEFSRLASRLDQAGQSHEICVTVISFEEQMRGWLSYLSRHRAVARQVEAYRRLNLLVKDFARRRVLDFDESAGQIFEQLSKSKVRLGTMDLKIAAISLTNEATLVSRNLRDYRRVPELTVEDWTVP